MQGSTAEFVVLQMCFKEQWTPDPIISSVNLNRRIQKHKRVPLPHEVLALLSCDLKHTEGFLDFKIEVKNKSYIK